MSQSQTSYTFGTPGTSGSSNSMTPLVYKIDERIQETSDCFTIKLSPVDSTGLPSQPFYFSPGQFNMLYHFGCGEAAISISGNPNSDHQLTHTIRVVGTLTRELSKIKVGETLGVRGPFGKPWPIESNSLQNLLVFAGGIGLAPVRPIIYHALNNRHDFGQVILSVGNRTADDLIFARELDLWSQAGKVTVLTTVDIAPSWTPWAGSVGLITELLSEIHFDLLDLNKTTAYVCGPEVMMKNVSEKLVQRGLAAENIYITMERNMRCALGTCGHCMWGADFVCKQGPVFAWQDIQIKMRIKEH